MNFDYLHLALALLAVVGWFGYFCALHDAAQLREIIRSARRPADPLQPRVRPAPFMKAKRRAAFFGE